MIRQTPAERRLFPLRLGVSVGLLAGLAWYLDLGAVTTRLARMEITWVVGALILSIVQTAASAWRWRFTAGRLGIDLAFREALREYYLAMFLNQVLPGGVVGDFSRAWRHARSPGLAQSAAGTAVRAVILERASGQAVMMTLAVVSLLSLPVALGVGPRLAALGAATVVAFVAGVVAVRRQRRSRESVWGRLWDDARAALLTGVALPVQLVTSILVVGSYIATFVLAARAVGVQVSLPTLLPLVAPVLVTMLIPVTLAGWGVREGAAAVLWGVVGLAAVDGVTVSAAYGLLILLASAPGGVILLAGALLGPTSVGRGRRGCPRPGESADMAGAEPRVATRSDPA